MGVGDFVRTKDGIIDKIRQILDNNTIEIYNKNDYYYSEFISKDEIIKSNPQIIDLIECNDIVINQLGEIIRPTSSNIDELKDYWKICENHIKQILTHEQFESEAYRLEE